MPSTSPNPVPERVAQQLAALAPYDVRDNPEGALADALGDPVVAAEVDRWRRLAAEVDTAGAAARVEAAKVARQNLDDAEHDAALDGIAQRVEAAHALLRLAVDDEHAAPAVTLAQLDAEVRAAVLPQPESMQAVLVGELRTERVLRQLERLSVAQRMTALLDSAAKGSAVVLAALHAEGLLSPLIPDDAGGRRVIAQAFDLIGAQRAPQQHARAQQLRARLAAVRRVGLTLIGRQASIAKAHTLAVNSRRRAKADAA